MFLNKGTVFPDSFPAGAVLLIDKPLGWTSFNAVNKVRYLLTQRLGIKAKKFKVGHAGTLDPLATGLLILCTGNNTKNIESLQAMSKTYTGCITFGATTPSFDLEKAIENIAPVGDLTDARIQGALPAYIGDIEQAPPIFSAVKVDGRRLYKNARTGQLVEMPFRNVHVDAFEIGPLRPVAPQAAEATCLSKKGASIMLHPDHAAGLQADFRVVCGKGTYIRSLAHDLGQALGCGAYLSSLRRTVSGHFSVEDAWEIPELESWIKGE